MCLSSSAFQPQHNPKLPDSKSTIKQIRMDLLNSSVMYPPMQSYKQYLENSSQDASEHGEDAAFLEKPTPKPRRRTWGSFFLRGCVLVFSPAVMSCVFSALTTVMLLLVLVSLMNGRPVNSTLKGEVPQVPKIQYHCGETPQEARALGCIFDVMSFAWTPPGKNGT